MRMIPMMAINDTANIHCCCCCDVICRVVLCYPACGIKWARSQCWAMSCVSSYPVNNVTIQVFSNFTLSRPHPILMYIPHPEICETTSTPHGWPSSSRHSVRRSESCRVGRSVCLQRMMWTMKCNDKSFAHYSTKCVRLCLHSTILPGQASPATDDDATAANIPRTLLVVRHSLVVSRPLLVDTGDDVWGLSPIHVPSPLQFPYW